MWVKERVKWKDAEGNEHEEVWLHDPETEERRKVEEGKKAGPKDPRTKKGR